MLGGSAANPSATTVREQLEFLESIQHQICLLENVSRDCVDQLLLNEMLISHGPAPRRKSLFRFYRGIVRVAYLMRHYRLGPSIRYHLAVYGLRAMATTPNTVDRR